MTDTSRTRHSYDLVAESYAAELSDELRGKPLDRALLSVVAEISGDGLVADLGCGPGHVAAHLAANGVRTVGLDLSPRMCATAARATALPFCAADMTALPLRDNTLAGIVCVYSVIHLDATERAQAYAEFARVLRPGGVALIAFHTDDAERAAGDSIILTEWWDQDVELTFRYLDPAAETCALSAAGLEITARLDREPHPGAEHPSRRSYLLVRASSH
ncbi:class I SAM-dependent methyltransferase [Fodinicola feengrottensis]|uniref:class I SAM-dependent methyltransferase n=1 Tax=Fodinicola feengrottensis TaxID=435914 RepID=UPI0013D5FA05|nr:class I SAM-dependent methyltransferase [Fodinicola feengrottensis]